MKPAGFPGLIVACVQLYFSAVSQPNVMQSVCKMVWSEQINVGHKSLPFSWQRPGFSERKGNALSCKSELRFTFDQVVFHDWILYLFFYKIEKLVISGVKLRYLYTFLTWGIYISFTFYLFFPKKSVHFVFSHHWYLHWITQKLFCNSIMCWTWKPTFS